ncbi:MAG: tetratricopeptide repeat protein [Acidobacteriia bacterium]|nr:tetratricopeptide repeat protein [Terriglobia bacterium]
MRYGITFLCLAWLCVAAPADVIRLKNGSRIVADSVHESNGRVEYTVGENTFAIPRSLVERIDAGLPANVPGSSSTPVASEDLPQVSYRYETSDQITSRVVHDGKIDVAALQAIEKEGVAHQSAVANYAAATFEQGRGHLPSAATYMQAALRFAPDEPALLESYATVLLQMGKYVEALPYAEHAVRLDPRSPEALNLLAFAWYKTDHVREAIDTWKKSLALRPDDKIAQILARVEREAKTEAGFHFQESSHFVLRYEGSNVQEGLRREIIAVLEQQYNTLLRDLGVAPQRSISVSLYTEQAFFDVTEAPSWTAAVNDGKLRIPVSGMSEMTPALQRVLRHELTHSFVAQLARGRVPQWLNEGLAQIEEPRSSANIGPRLALLYASGNQVPLNQLESSFLSLSGQEAAVVYAESLAAVECIRARYGMSDIARILQRLGDGESIETALRSTIHGGYASLEAELGDYLKRAYGQ